ncbi:metal ABC transporter substrate-binding protein [Rosenbergiella australiborealis]|uniref:metal ABC transporter substrate-binding protein n=1 Tax=Rosenbergiella australiborealis TaxID=1544696 RepID=UPI001F4DEA6D|nr:metal ABC transporter substrate-binding protein [Rosenbergiella australiborealis]
MKVPALAVSSLLLISHFSLAAPVQVVASFTVLADITQQIGGNDVTVKSLVAPNGDPHSFEPTANDSRALAMAQVVVVNGLGLEGWMDRLVMASGYRGKITVASSGITTNTMQEEGKTVTDPHAWNSLANGEVYARNIMKALEKADPEHAADYQKRADAYIQKMQQLDQWAIQQYKSIPANRRLVLTSHDAFGYYGKRYGVTFSAPLGLSTESEASAQQVGDLITQMKKKHIKHYFTENQTDPRLVKQIAVASGATPGGELYPEALSTAEGPAPTYLSAFKYNTEQLLQSMR